MQDVRVIGVESGALLLATDGGTSFRLPVTSSLPGQVRQANPEAGPQKRVSRRTCRPGSAALPTRPTSHRRSTSTSSTSGASRVPCSRARLRPRRRPPRPVTPVDTDAPDTFGEAITAKLESGDATAVHWASWKHVEQGWVVRVRYTAAEVEHDAQWLFDPKTSTLTPDNGDAHRLSHTEDEGIAAPPGRRERPPGHRRHPLRLRRVPRRAARRGPHEPRGPGASAPGAAPPHRCRGGRGALPGNETADLLEALRRRRGEREARRSANSATSRAAPRSASSTSRSPASTRRPRPHRSARTPVRRRPRGESRPERKKRSRRSMPSWDEIVFGTRPDPDDGLLG